MDTRRARIIVATLVATFVVMRILLHRSPDSDFDVVGYNIHHLFIATDGTNASYLLPVSLRGGIVMISLATLYVAMLYMVGRRRR